jgi:hypothetical protein
MLKVRDLLGLYFFLKRREKIYVEPFVRKEEEDLVITAQRAA